MTSKLMQLDFLLNLRAVRQPLLKSEGAQRAHGAFLSMTINLSGIPPVSAGMVSGFSKQEGVRNGRVEKNEG